MQKEDDNCSQSFLNATDAATAFDNYHVERERQSAAAHTEVYVISSSAAGPTGKMGL